MKPRSILRLSLAAGLACALSACSTPRETFYTLNPAIAPTAPEPLPRYSVEVTAVTVPDIVDRPQLVVRNGDNRVDLLEQQRWAAPLSTQMLTMVAENLSRLLPEARVKATGEAAVADAAWRVAVDVQRLELTPGQGVLLAAQWSARRLGDGLLRVGRVDVTEPAGAGYDALVAASARTLAPLCRQIADALRAEPPPATPPPRR